jgi:hypothetical protein
MNMTDKMMAALEDSRGLPQAHTAEDLIRDLSNWLSTTRSTDMLVHLARGEVLIVLGLYADLQALRAASQTATDTLKSEGV